MMCFHEEIFSKKSWWWVFLRSIEMKLFMHSFSDMMVQNLIESFSKNIWWFCLQWRHFFTNEKKKKKCKWLTNDIILKKWSKNLAWHFFYWFVKKKKILIRMCILLCNNKIILYNSSYHEMLHLNLLHYILLLYLMHLMLIKLSWKEQINVFEWFFIMFC